MTYTAFGEMLCRAGETGCAVGSPTGSAPADFPRYGYAGAWGYERGLVALADANPALPPLELAHLG